MIAALMQRQGEDEQQQLLRLYWNRAGVKRELVSLKREHFELLEKIEQQESEILRAQNQLEGLERLLTDPLAAANAMVYFQLRHMWRIGALKIEQFARELTAQREKREQSQLHSAVLAKRNRRLQAIEVKLAELGQKRQKTISELRACEAKLAGLNFLMKLFAGPSLRKQAQTHAGNRDVLDDRIREFEDIVEKIKAEPLPEPDGLSLESRRLINVAVVSLAQHLVLHFAANDLARLARKASRRSVADMRFGDRRLCDRMVEQIRERIDELNRDRRLADKVKRRADRLMESIRYRHETDAVPMRASLSEIAPLPDTERGGEANPRVNVLEDDYWELSGSLL